MHFSNSRHFASDLGDMMSVTCGSLPQYEMDIHYKTQQDQERTCQHRVFLQDPLIQQRALTATLFSQVLWASGQPVQRDR